MKKHYNIDRDEDRRELINHLKDFVKIASEVSDATTYRESAFKLVLQNLLEGFFENDCEHVDRMGEKLKWQDYQTFISGKAVLEAISKMERK